MTYYKRTIEQKLLSSMQNSKAIFVLGPRQVGKTTLIKHLMEAVGPENSLYYDVELRENLEAFSGNLESLLAKLRFDKKSKNGKTYICLDEIQNVTDFSKTVKLLVDHHSDEFKLILTGSSSALIKKQFEESLVGRKEETSSIP